MERKDKDNLEISQLSSAKKETVCAVVVTYNRKELLLECLEALRKQTRPLDAIYIIDNASTDGTPEILLEHKYIPKLPSSDLIEPWEISSSILSARIQTNGSQTLVTIHYVRMHENTGGAGGFYEGVKRGYKKGHDWFWLMDDDAEPKEDAFEYLSNYFKKNNVSALASVVRNATGISFCHRGLLNFKKIFPLIQKPLKVEFYKNNNSVEIDIASFVGILINKKAIQKIGYPKEEFFIHHDDVEYCIRLRQAGRILLVNNSIIFHKEANKKEKLPQKSFFNRKLSRTPYDKLWLSYYGKRNLIWLGKKYNEDKYNFYFNLLKYYLFSITGIILYDDHKLKRIKFITNAYLDGLRSVFDNKKPKEILYQR